MKLAGLDACTARCVEVLIWCLSSTVYYFLSFQPFYSVVVGGLRLKHAA